MIKVECLVVKFYLSENANKLTVIATKPQKLQTDLPKMQTKSQISEFSVRERILILGER